ncbi:hypothetical protein [Acetobacter papayae]|uniref:hypothetical protein n=1 Tax=Acetobacter papayae TaxID=1076592 RepID=UPI0011DCD5EE|nr:hypothetical protein [Acetobacter papayae]
MSLFNELVPLLVLVIIQQNFSAPHSQPDYDQGSQDNAHSFYVPGHGSFLKETVSAAALFLSFLAA